MAVIELDSSSDEFSDGWEEDDEDYYDSPPGEYDFMVFNGAYYGGYGR